MAPPSILHAPFAVGAALAIVGALAACAPQAHQGPSESAAPTSEARAENVERAAIKASGSPRSVALAASPTSSAIASSPAPSADPPSSAAPSAKPPPPIAPDDAEAFLFPTNAARMAPEVIVCRAKTDAGDRIRCMITHLLKDDPLASKAALELYERTGDVVGLEGEQVMDGGYRGKLHLVPEAPILAQRKHLEWVTAALFDYDTFMSGITAAAPAGSVRYRVRPIALRFFRSVKARTPTAFAYDWTVAYNLAGSLNGSADAVRETMFHEMFHLNDKAHGTWSVSALGALYIDITARCGTKIPCLTPYAPSETVIRGGTYYAFHPDNGVVEYAAELALRYYREQRAMILHKKLAKPPFKCGPEENARAWALLAAEFFGGADLVPACPPR